MIESIQFPVPRSFFALNVNYLLGMDFKLWRSQNSFLDPLPNQFTLSYTAVQGSMSLSIEKTSPASKKIKKVPSLNVVGPE